MTPALKGRREPLLISRKDVADMLGVSPRTVSKLTKAGYLRAVVIGRALRFDVAQVVDFASRGTGGGA